MPEALPHLQHTRVRRIAPHLALRIEVASLLQSLQRGYRMIRLVHPDMPLTESRVPNAEALSSPSKGYPILRISRIAPISGVARGCWVTRMLPPSSHGRERCLVGDATDAGLAVLL